MWCTFYDDVSSGKKLIKYFVNLVTVIKSLTIILHINLYKKLPACIY